MSIRFQRIVPFLWFNEQAEEAVKYYISIFANSKIVTTTRYSRESSQASGRAEGSVMTIAFELDGQPLTALNGGPHFKFTEAVSLAVNCHSQDEIEHYWSKLSYGGDENAQVCGWLKDRYGLSWQVVPAQLPELLSNADPEKSRKVMSALLEMKKIDLEALQQAAR